MSDETDTKAEAKSPDEIRDDIKQTRADLGDTVAALGAKTDVKGRAQERMDELKSDAKHKADELKAKATSDGGADAADDGSPSGARQALRDAGAKVKANPLPVAVAAALLLGYAIGRRGRR